MGSFEAARRAREMSARAWAASRAVALSKWMSDADFSLAAVMLSGVAPAVESGNAAKMTARTAGQKPSDASCCRIFHCARAIF